MLISVVILNWNGAHFLREYLPKVIEYTSSVYDSEVVVADNGSDDDSLELLKNKFPSVRIIALDKNYGFTGGYNRAITQINSKYVMLLNSDVLVSKNYLQPLIQELEKNNDIAAVMPKILSITEPNKFEYAGAAGGYLDFLGFPYCRGRILSHTEVDNGQYDENCDIFWTSGAAMVVKREIYEELGGLDEQFFLHMEEIDFSWRIKNKGYRLVCVSSSKVYHLGGGTLNNNSPRKLYYNFRNSLFMLYKNLPTRYMFILFLRMCFDGLIALLYLLTLKLNCTKAVFLAHIDFYRALNKLKEKRESTVRTNDLMTKSLIIIELIRK